jgi:hypothetical protein
MTQDPKLRGWHAGNSPVHTGGPRLVSLFRDGRLVDDLTLQQARVLSRRLLAAVARARAAPRKRS